jgi:two-component system, OmpR family, response regulator
MPSNLEASHFDSVNPTSARVMVADDDPSSCRFFGDGLRSLGAQVEIFTDGLVALQRSRAETFDLLLLDCRMPGAGALQILTQLRSDAQASSRESFAVVTTAWLEPGDRQPLLAAGFSEILIKPCGLANLKRVLALVQPDRHDGLVLDDQAALIATGEVATMRALRQLLREELTQLDQELDQLSRDSASFSERLHRLRSSCGFCGATALSTQAALLQRQLAQYSATPAFLARFHKALLATLRALDA